MTTRQRLQLWKRRYATWENLWRVLLVIAMLILAAWGLYLGWSYPENVIRGWSYWKYSLVNLGPELAGIVIGVVFIDALNERRQTQQLKAQLIRQMGSPSKDVALPAVRELAHHFWLYDGSLKGANLEGANLDAVNINLKKANLEGANLQGAKLGTADLLGANLKGAKLVEAHLEETILHGAHLENAHLVLAHLEGANLFDAALDGARLEKAQLNGAILLDVNLMGANLFEATGLTAEQLSLAKNTTGAIMPDGVKLNETDRTLEKWLDKKPNCLVWEDVEG